MNAEPLISVVIPTYNRPRSTASAIESVIAQTYPSLEIIIVDDGSNAASRAAIGDFISRIPIGQRRPRYFWQPNQGPSAARNTGVAKAAGEYLAFLDSDDVWLPEKLELQMRAVDELKPHCGACLTDTHLVDGSGQGTTTFKSFGRTYEGDIGVEPDPAKSLARAFCGFWISALLVRRDLIQRIDGFDANVNFAEDRDFYFRLSLITSIAYVNRPLVRTDRGRSPIGSTCRPWEKVEVRLRGQQIMLEKWLRMDALPEDVRKIVEQNLGDVHSQWTNWNLEDGRFLEARTSVTNAMIHAPRFGLVIKWILTWTAPGLARKITPQSKPYLWTGKQ